MYYPNKDEPNGNSELKFGKFQLKCLSEKNCQDDSKEYVIRTIECENSELNVKRQILHFHYRLHSNLVCSHISVLILMFRLFVTGTGP